MNTTAIELLSEKQKTELLLKCYEVIKDYVEEIDVLAEYQKKLGRDFNAPSSYSEAKNLLELLNNPLSKLDLPKDHRFLRKFRYGWGV